MSDAATLHPDEAIRIVIEAGHAAHINAAHDNAGRGRERAGLIDALGRILAEPLYALVDQPPFDKSAMDGFAWSGPPGGIPQTPGRETRELRVIASVAAGASHARPVAEGECVRIMTGAPLPPGCHAVQRVEWTDSQPPDTDGTEWVRFTRPEGVTNVIRRGENQKAGELLLTPRLLAPQDIGILASSGYAQVEVAPRVRVGVVSTGDEIVAPGTLPLPPAAIYDSNGPALCAQARAAGADARWYGAFPDQEAPLRAALALALDENDLVVVSGGVSMGDYDFVPVILPTIGVRRVFHKIAMRPGKPTWFGVSGDKAVFGLPGNPVSTFVNFEVLVKSYIYARAGIEWKPPILRAALAESLSRRESDRVDFLPATLENDPAGLTVRPARYHGSSMLSVLSGARALIRMEMGVDRIGEGEMVDVRLIRA